MISFISQSLSKATFLPDFPMANIGLLLLKALASVFSLAMILSPSLDMRRLRQQRHTGEMALMPLVGLWISCHMWCVSLLTC